MKSCAFWISCANGTQYFATNYLLEDGSSLLANDGAEWDADKPNGLNFSLDMLDRTDEDGAVS